jgi:hypothetical protein
MKVPLMLSGGMMAAGLAFALEPAPVAKFRAQVIDSQVGIGYGIAVADVDGDGLDDILLVDAKETAWYKNPTWEKHQMTGHLSKRDHVCIAACDITGDGKAEVVIGAEWNPGDTVDSGSVHALFAPPDRTAIWKDRQLHREPTVHRMHWVREAAAGHFLAVLPLHGCRNVGGEGEGINILGYRPETDPEKDWETFLIHKGFNLAHNFDPVVWEKDGTGESLLIAAKQGVHLLQPKGETWQATQMTEPPAGEVRQGRLPDGRRFITTVEPMHGHQVVVNPAAEDGLWSARRVVLDETLAEGHGLAAADFLGTGYDQVVAGWRLPSKDNQKVGLRLYVPTRPDGSEWKLHTVIDDNQMACEDLKAADLNGDGKPDLIASGRATHNLIIYWNEGGAE